MTRALGSAAVADAFVAACDAELQALKPGNVHVHGAGHGMEVRHFEMAAAAAAPFIARRGARVGERVQGAVEASMAAAGCNTNLGIVLLCAPLAAAAEPGPAAGELRARLDRVLDGLDRADAAHVYQAIVLAKPAGLGTTESEDVAKPPTGTLLEAMRLAAGRDRIARAYVTGFEDVFGFGLGTLRDALSRAEDESEAVTALHMALLAEFPDSHIARKHGKDRALEVRDKARAMAPLCTPPFGGEARAALLDFDRDLKARGLNPGTTADFVVATLFAGALIRMEGSHPPA